MRVSFGQSSRSYTVGRECVSIPSFLYLLTCCLVSLYFDVFVDDANVLNLCGDESETWIGYLG